jgi:outer membrane protein OmpA-like peptidoglycan-associated protein
MMRKQIVISAAAVLLAACSSPPKPAMPDGGSRVPANDPAKVQALQDRVATDRALLSENNLLKAQVSVLTQKLNEMTSIVREALVLPPPTPIKPPAPVAAPSAPASPQSAAPQLPLHAFKQTPDGMVIRVFHPFAKTDFEPSELTAKAIRDTARNATTIEVRGMTDSAVVNPIDKMIAIERAEKARIWLVDNGVSPSKIRVRYFSAGQFIADNRTEAGRALNRRVEVDIRKPVSLASL